MAGPVHGGRGHVTSTQEGEGAGGIWKGGVDSDDLARKMSSLRRPAM